jgi:hypothetical protein
MALAKEIEMDDVEFEPCKPSRRRGLIPLLTPHLPIHSHPSTTPISSQPSSIILQIHSNSAITVVHSRCTDTVGITGALDRPSE